MLALLLTQHVVHADDAVRARGASVVHDCGVGLDPHPATVLGQEAVVFRRHLALIDYWKEGEKESYKEVRFVKTKSINLRIRCE